MTTMKGKMTFHVAIVGVLLAACMLQSCTSTVQMVTDQRLLDSPLTVKGTNGNMIKQKISFGEYKTTSVRRSAWKSQAGYTGVPEVFTVAFEKTKQTIRFQLTDGIHSSYADCLDISRSKQYVTGNNPNSLLNIATDLATYPYNERHVYRAIINTNDNNGPWTLEIDDVQFHMPNTTYKGILKRGNQTYTVVPIQKVKGKDRDVRIGTIGFEIKNNGGLAVAAVSQIGKPTVYLNTENSSEKFLLANACTALLVKTVQ